MSKKALSAQDDERGVRSPPAPDLDMDHVRVAVRGIRYGEVRLIIQDGVVVQIDRLEKQRLR